MTRKALQYPIPRGAIRIALPDSTQLTDYSCGASCLESICKYYGVGPDEEWEFVRALKMDRRIGSHPFQIARLARRYGLSVREYLPMSIENLVAELRKRHPVMLMIQAWGDNPPMDRSGRPDYSEDWIDGHWVVAIGYTTKGFIFEDPSLEQVRGYIETTDLMRRWRDTGPHGKQMPQYGMAIWHPRKRRSSYETQAAPIR